MGCDPNSFFSSIMFNSFQFTHPVWGATDPSSMALFKDGVSIHAPRVGCDAIGISQQLFIIRFQFTHPVWGATTLWNPSITIKQVSIHAPRVGCDCDKLFSLSNQPRFNSRTPCGVRPNVVMRRFRHFRSFNSRTPCGVRHIA